MDRTGLLPRRAADIERARWHATLLAPSSAKSRSWAFAALSLATPLIILASGSWVGAMIWFLAASAGGAASYRSGPPIVELRIVKDRIAISGPRRLDIDRRELVDARLVKNILQRDAAIVELVRDDGLVVRMQLESWRLAERFLADAGTERTRKTRELSWWWLSDRVLVEEAGIVAVRAGHAQLVRFEQMLDCRVKLGRSLGLEPRALVQIVQRDERVVTVARIALQSYRAAVLLDWAGQVKGAIDEAHRLWQRAQTVEPERIAGYRTPPVEG